jgi:hypothetical protein
MQGEVKTVKVLGQRHEIMVYKQPGSSWFASGNFMGQPLKVQGSTRGAAAKEWRDAASYNGMDAGELAESRRTGMFVLMGLLFVFSAILFGLPVLSWGRPF